MNALVIGGGHLGTFLKERLKPTHHYVGVMDHLTQNYIDDMDVSVVINTAGKTSLEACEKNPLQAFESNVAQPVRLLRKIKDQLYIHISSGCIWDGPYDEGRPFLPGSPPTPACFYSWTKVCCEAIMRKETHRRKVAILRPRQVYSPVHSPRNTLSKLISYPKLIDTPNSMTSAETIAKTIEFLVHEKDATGFGVPIEMNVYDEGIISPYKVGMIMYEMGLRDKPLLMTKDDLDLELKPRRVDVVMEDDFFSCEVEPPNVTNEMKRVVTEYAKRSK